MNDGQHRRPRFNSVVLDVDSTLCGLEGIDWLGVLRGPEVAHRISGLTDGAMRGEIPLERVYGERLSLVRPTRGEMRQLARAYMDAIAEGAAEAVRLWRGNGIRVVVVSSGIRDAILDTAVTVGVEPRDVHAVDVRFHDDGEYAGFDESSALARADGKRAIVEGLDLDRPVLVVGDGATDLAMRDAADAFAAFTGFVTRDAIVAQADYAVNSFEQLTALIL